MNTPPRISGLATPSTPRFGPKFDPPVARRRDASPTKVTFADDPFTDDAIDSSSKHDADVESGMTKLNAHTLSQQGFITPAKTPSKKRRAPKSGATSSSAKLLFGEEIKSKTAVKSTVSEIDPFGFSEETPRRRRSTRTAVFEDESAEFEIYTDTNLRTPELDDTPDNPFLDRDEDEGLERVRKLKEARKKAEKKFKELGGNRKDGFVYTFRGKKFFKKFDEDDPRQEIKPRLLFPSSAQLQERAEREWEDEEEETEIEDNLEKEVEREETPPPPRANASSLLKETAKVTKSKSVRIQTPKTPSTPRVTRAAAARASVEISPSALKSPKSPKSPVTRSSTRHVRQVTPEEQVTKTPATPKTPKTPQLAHVPRTPPRRAAKRKFQESPAKTGSLSPRKKRALRG